MEKTKTAIKKKIIKRDKNNKRKDLKKRIVYLYNIIRSKTLPELYKIIGEDFDPVRHLSFKENYACGYCNRVFASSCSLGGHVSRTHSDKAATSENARAEKIVVKIEEEVRRKDE